MVEYRFKFFKGQGCFQCNAELNLEKPPLNMPVCPGEPDLFWYYGFCNENCARDYTRSRHTIALQAIAGVWALADEAEANDFLTDEEEERDAQTR